MKEESRKRTPPELPHAAPTAGEYRAKFEDNRGYYYQAPEKIVGNNTRAWLWDGGLFVPKGESTPDRYYTIGRNNMVSLHRLGQTLEIQFSP